MIVPKSFAIHVTYTCPLSCSHCCFSSSPSNRDQLSTSRAEELIEAIDKTSVRLVAFTGGEPFLLGRDLVRLVRLASDRGFRTRIVTSAYFGTSQASASERLKQVADVGLNELSISWDDFHEEYVPFERINTVFWSARRLGISVAVNTVVYAKSRWTAARVRAALALAEDDPAVTVQSAVNLTGRAAESLGPSDLHEQRAVGPCPYVLTGPTVSAKGKLLACCGVIPNTEALTVAEDITGGELNAAINRASESALLNWLYLRGPYAIVEHIGMQYGIKVPAPNEFGGNCEACQYLFQNPEISVHIPAALTEKCSEIANEVYLLDALGLLQPEIYGRLWSRRSFLAEISQLESDG
ncbi:MAG TPA: radical SAM protein [Thermoanaerobaculia bacterium]